jgi:hypothetical protein
MGVAPVLWMVLAAGGGADLRVAEAAFEGARYDQVLVSVKAALEGPLSPLEKQRAYELLAFTHAAFNETAEAVAAFTDLLALDPGYEPSLKVSPKIRGLFDKARADVPRPPPPPPSLIPPPAHAASARPEVTQAPPARSEERGVLHRWWFWSAVGAAAIAGTATAWVVTHPGPSGTLGAGRLP